MAKYTGIISLNSDSLTDNPMTNNYVHVRIPTMHGPASIEDYTDSNVPEKLRYHVADKDLPMAHVLQPIGSSGIFLPSEYFKDGEVVLVEAVNDDLNNLLVLGKLSNYTATSDEQIIQNRINGIIDSSGAYSNDDPNLPSFRYGNSLINVAKGEIGVHEEGYSNKVKYNDDIWGPGHNWAWCCTFVCWCFQKAGLSQYFYGGGKTASCQYLYDYHRSKGEGMTNNYKAGDIVFFNWDGGANTQHVGIVIEDQVGNKVKTIEGNTSASGSQSNGGKVMEKNRDLSKIVGGYRPGKSMTNEYQCYQYFTQTMGLNTAAACGILGNIYYESSFNTNTVGDGGTSFGLCQWHNGRYDNLKKYCSEGNMNYTQLIPQLSYLNYELNNGYLYVLNAIRQVSNTSQGAYDAADVWCRRFEIPANVNNEVTKKRGPMAQQYFKKYKTN